MLVALFVVAQKAVLGRAFLCPIWLAVDDLDAHVAGDGGWIMLFKDGEVSRLFWGSSHGGPLQTTRAAVLAMCHGKQVIVSRCVRARPPVA
jgi:hypothetical protein